jgi:putative transposase
LHHGGQRPWRIQFENAIYHLTARGNSRQAIFLDDKDKASFIELLSRASARFKVEIFAFCLMSNHYHLFLRTPLGNLSKAIAF